MTKFNSGKIVNSQLHGQAMTQILISVPESESRQHGRLRLRARYHDSGSDSDSATLAVELLSLAVIRGNAISVSMTTAGKDRCLADKPTFRAENSFTQSEHCEQHIPVTLSLPSSDPLLDLLDLDGPASKSGTGSQEQRRIQVTARIDLCTTKCKRRSLSLKIVTHWPTHIWLGTCDSQAPVSLVPMLGNSPSLLMKL